MKFLAPALLPAIALFAFMGSHALAKPKPPGPVSATADAVGAAVSPANSKPLQSLLPAQAGGYPLASDKRPLSDSCRPACARQYYFCLAGAEPDQCPEQWTECRAACRPTPGLDAAGP